MSDSSQAQSSPEETFLLLSKELADMLSRVPFEDEGKKKILKFEIDVRARPRAGGGFEHIGKLVAPQSGLKIIDPNWVIKTKDLSGPSIIYEVLCEKISGKTSLKVSRISSDFEEFSVFFKLDRNAKSLTLERVK